MVGLFAELVTVTASRFFVETKKLLYLPPAEYTCRWRLLFNAS